MFPFPLLAFAGSVVAALFAQENAPSREAEGFGGTKRSARTRFTKPTSLAKDMKSRRQKRKEKRGGGEGEQGAEEGDQEGGEENGEDLDDVMEAIDRWVLSDQIADSVSSDFFPEEEDDEEDL